MANAQFYAAVGLPVFSILVVWLGTTASNNRAIGALGKRMDDMNQRIEGMNQSLNQHIDDRRSEMKAGFAGVNERLSRLETRFDRIEDEVRKDHEGRLARLEARVFARSA